MRVDHALDYRTAGLEAAIAAAAPNGVHVYFENVGGAVLDAVLPNMALGGRIPVCGLITTYQSETPAPGPLRYDQVLMKRLKIEGFFLPDFWNRGETFPGVLRDWHDAGTLTTTFDVTRGLENVLVAYDRMNSGKNIGKTIVDLT
jgi:NADPH-dependent curcumin reductase CurA